MRTSWSIDRLPRGVALLGSIAVATFLLSSCGGGTSDGPEMTAQQQREAAALQRAHSVNVDAMGKIKAERAAAAAAK